MENFSQSMIEVKQEPEAPLTKDHIYEVVRESLSMPEMLEHGGYKELVEKITKEWRENEYAINEKWSRTYHEAEANFKTLLEETSLSHLQQIAERQSQQDSFLKAEKAKAIRYEVKVIDAWTNRLKMTEAKFKEQESCYLQQIATLKSKILYDSIISLKPMINTSTQTEELCVNVSPAKVLPNQVVANKVAASAVQTSEAKKSPTKSPVVKNDTAVLSSNSTTNKNSAVAASAFKTSETKKSTTKSPVVKNDTAMVLSNLTNTSTTNKNNALKFRANAAADTTKASLKSKQSSNRVVAVVESGKKVSDVVVVAAKKKKKNTPPARKRVMLLEEDIDDEEDEGIHSPKKIQKLQKLKN